MRQHRIGLTGCGSANSSRERLWREKATKRLRHLRRRRRTRRRIRSRPRRSVTSSGWISGDRALAPHETACILNAGDEDAQIKLTLYFAEREPAGPYRVTVPARRTLHLRFNDLRDPESVPFDTDYASVFESNVPVV